MQLCTLDLYYLPFYFLFSYEHFIVNVIYHETVGDSDPQVEVTQA